MVAIVVEPSRASEVIPYRGGRASERYSASSLDDRGSVSRSRVTTLQRPSIQLPLPQYT